MKEKELIPLKDVLPLIRESSDVNSLLPLSFSSLSNFKQCKRKFRYDKIDKLPREFKMSEPLIKGGAVHDILEHFPNQSNHEYAKTYEYIIQEFLKTDIAKKYLFTKSTREFSFGLTPNLKLTDFFNKKSLFRGKIDHICIIDGVLFLVDWKTGKVKEQRYQDFTQLLFYAVVMFLKNSSIKEIDISYVYVEHGQENKLRLLRDNLESYLGELLNLIYSVLSEKEYPKTITPLCDWCDFQEICQNEG